MEFGGDVVGFLKKIENIDFKDAIEILAERVNIALPKIELRRSRAKENAFERKGICSKQSSCRIFP